MISEDDIKNADYLNIPEIIMEWKDWQKAANTNAANGIKRATERLKRYL